MPDVLINKEKLSSAFEHYVVNTLISNSKPTLFEIEQVIHKIIEKCKA